MRRAQVRAEDFLDFACCGLRDRLVRFHARKDQHRLANDADAYAAQCALRCGGSGTGGVAAVQHAGARYRREGVTRIVIACVRIAQRIHHLRRVGQGAADDAGAIVVDVRADRAADERQQRLVRQNQRDGVVIRRSAARHAGLFAQTAHRQVGGDRHAGARARAKRGGACAVVGRVRISGPGAALVAVVADQHLGRRVAPRVVLRHAVVFGVHGLGVNDRALAAQLRHELVIARRKVDVVARIAAAGRTHVSGIERILERERHAVHRHGGEIGLAAELPVELGGAFQRIGLLAELLAHGRCVSRQRARGGRAVELRLARD